LTQLILSHKERALAKSLFETSDGRPSALAVSIASNATLSASKGKAPAGGAGAGTFEPGQAVNGKSGRLLSAEEKKKIEKAIQNASSLEEIRRLEETLRLGYALDDGDVGKGANGKSGKGAEEEEEVEMEEED
jgi:U2 small nuclear ribonucleoprotein A'